MNGLRRWTALPISREGRDTLWLLAVLAVCIAPHAGRLPLWCSLGTAAAVIWRASLAWRDAPLPSRWVLLACLAASVALTLGTFHSLMGREAGVTLVTLLAGLKTLELRARRDAFVITSLGFFLILTQFLHSQGPGMALLMSLALIGLLSSLVLAQRPLGRPTIASAMWAAGRSVLWGLPLMLALYLLFPRIGPLWTLPSDAGARTGLSEQLSLGRVAELALDDSIAMRLQFEGKAPPPQVMYFRGPVLDMFDGRQWTARPPLSHLDELDELRLPTDPGPAVNYEVTLEPSSLRAVPLLEGTLEVTPAAGSPGITLHRNGLNWLADSSLNERVRLKARAVTRVQQGPDLAVPDLRLWTQLPTGFNPRTLAWAMALRQRSDLRDADTHTLTLAVLQHIRQAGYSYTLAPGDEALNAQGQPEPDLIDRFWLDRRSGFCEHFATAFVVVMRAMDVPSRVVTGFQGAELNPIDGLYVVRNSDAHAWAEVWQAGQGWIRVDPTAAVAPERIDRTRPLIRRPATAAGRLAQLAPDWMVKGRAAMDAANHRWNTWVLAYSRNSQIDLLKGWGWDSPSGLDLLRLCFIVIVSLATAGVAWLWWTRPRQRATPWQAPLWRVHRALLRAGLPAPVGSPAPAPALAWHHVIPRALSEPHQQDTRQALVDALQALDALRYGPHSADSRKLPPGVREHVTRIEQLARQWQQARSRKRSA